MNVKEYRRQVEAEQERARTEGRFALSVVPGPDDWILALAALGDRAADAAARLEALGTLQAGAFDIGHFAPFTATFVAALQGIAVAADEPADLRRMALDHLANEGDAVALQVLTAQIEDPGSAIMTGDAALEMLARDDHAAGVALARRMMTESDSSAVRAQAARILGSDPASADLLQGLMADPAEAPEVRQAGAVALRALQRDTFRAAARSLPDVETSPEMRATIGRGLGNIGGEEGP